MTSSNGDFFHDVVVGLYAPDQPVRRDQMGSFLARMLQLATADGHLAPPTS